MNKRSLVNFCILTLGLLMGGCATSPRTPHVAYPVTYDIQVNNTQVHSDYGPQNLSVNATQDVAVASGQTLYYQVVSPVDVTVYFYGVDSPGQRAFLGQMQGTSFTSSIVPSTGTLEFMFIATHPNSSGTLKFTLSDQPIAPAVAQ